MNFSLICPTRNRTQNIINLIDSIDKKTVIKDKVELLIIYDKDDTKTAVFFQNFNFNTYDFKIKVFTRYRSPNINGDYYNYLAQQAEGKYIWAVGDDTEIVTDRWDEILLDRISNYKSLNQIKDDILFISIEDTTPAPLAAQDSPMFCCFPLISNSATKLLGFFFHRDIFTWGADLAIFMIYSHQMVNRAIVVEEIILKHWCHHNQSSQRDETNLGIEEKWRINQVTIGDVLANQIHPYAVRLSLFLLGAKDGICMDKQSFDLVDKNFSRRNLSTAIFQIYFDVRDEARIKIKKVMKRKDEFYNLAAIVLLLSYLPRCFALMTINSYAIFLMLTNKIHIFIKRSNFKVIA